MPPSIFIRYSVTASGLSYYLRRTLRRSPSSLAASATRSHTLSPAGEVPAINPIIFPHHLPKILGADFSVSADEIRRDLHRSTFRFSPVTAHEFQNAFLLDSAAFLGNFRYELRPHPRGPSLRPLGPVATLDFASLASTPHGSRWFGHWLQDELPHQLLAATLAPPILHHRPRYTHESGYHTLFKIPEPPRLGVARFKKLIVIDEFAQNPSKTRRYHQMRQTLAAQPKGHEKIYLLRGNTGNPRRLLNEQEIITKLESQGFIPIDTSTATAAQIIAVLNQAQVIIGVEGSHMLPTLFAAVPRAALIILNPPHRTHTTIPDTAAFCGLYGAMFIGDPTPNSSDFTINPEELLRFIDHVTTTIAQDPTRIDRFVQSVLSA